MKDGKVQVEPVSYTFKIIAGAVHKKTNAANLTGLGGI